MAAEIISTGVATNLVDSEGDLDPDEGLAAVDVREFDIPVAMHGWRLDRALSATIPEFSRSYLQQLMGDGAVAWRSAPALKAAAKVAVGDRVRVELRPTQQAMAFVAQPMPLDVVYEDGDLLVIHKPAGLVVHPAAGHWSGTLLNGLLAYHRDAASLPRAGIVHRLDKDTSGLMLVGKSRRAVDALVRAIAAREVHREYLALAHGRWQGAAERDVEQAVGRDPHNRLRMAVLPATAAGAKAARTSIRLLDSDDRMCLVACKLHTGRTHQIRVHMTWLGHPLVGDAVYGGRPLDGMARQALHAARLRLAHPVSGQPLAFACEPPPDMVQAIAQSGLRYNPDQLG